MGDPTTTETTRLDRFGAACGVAFVALALVGTAITGEEDLSGPEEPATVIAAELADRSDQVEVGSIFLLLGLAFFLFFLGYLRRLLRRAEGEDGWLTSVAYGGGLALVASMLMLLLITLATSTVSTSDPVVAKTLYSIQWNGVLVLGPPLIALAAATSAVILRYGALPRWLGWTGIVVAVLGLAPWIGIFVFGAWTLALSIVALVRPMDPTADERSVEMAQG